MRIDNSKPMPGPVPQVEDAASSKLGEIKSVNGSTETQLSVKYTMFLPDGAALKEPAGKSAEAFKSVSGMKTDTDEFTSRTLPAADGVVADQNSQQAAIAKAKLGELLMNNLVKSSELNAQLKEATSIEIPNLTAAQKPYQHNQNDLEFLVPKKTDQK